MSDQQSRISNPYPRGPQYVSVGPLDQGMVRNKDTAALKVGELLTLKNFHAEPVGPTRRNGSVYFAGGVAVTYAPLRDVVTLYKSDGNQYVALLDKYFLYKRSGLLLSRHAFGYSAGTIKTSGALVIGSSLNWSSAGIGAGDFILLKPGVSQQEIQIAARLTLSKLQLISTPSPGPYAAGSAHKDYKAFAYVSNARWVDWTVAPVTRTSGVPKMALSDGKRPLFGWDGSALAPWSGSLTFIPLCVCFFQDRLFCANIIEGGSTFRRRIRWSSITDSSSFIGTPDVQWTDRPYGDGEILRLIPFGKLLAVFYSDGLDIGRPSNYAGDAMPLAFEHVNTGGSGLVGMKAAARFYDGIFCAMEDGFYFLDNNGFKDIGEPIWKYATEDIANFQGTVVQIDWRNRCAVFGVPTNDGTNIGKLWCYNYETKKWSWDDISCTMLGSYLEGNAPTWDGTSGTWDSQTAAWDAFSVAYRKKLSFGRAGKLFLMDPTATRDADGSLIEAVIETGDIDLQLGNFVKTAFQLVLTADRIMTADMSFNIEGSVDRGNTWKALGLLTIGAGTDNNQVTFKLTGATLRFRITHSGLSTPYALPTLDIRVRTRGREAHFG